MTWKQPDNDGKDDWSNDDAEAMEDATGAPGYQYPASFPRYLRPLFGVGEIACPKCLAANAIRRGEHNGRYVPEKQLPPILMRFTYRSRDRAIWCHLHDEYTIRCSEDTILRALLPPAEAA